MNKTHTYVMRRSQSLQIFWPVGKPPVLGGFGELTGGLTCLVNDGW